MKLILGLLSALLICPLHAIEIFEMDGVTDGGGGRGVVCYDDNNKVKSVELLDFYEAELLEGYNIPERNGTLSEIMNGVSKKAQHDLIKAQIEYWGRVYEGFKFLRAGIRLKPVQDSGHIFDIGSNCKIEQIANFQGFSRIFVVGDYWNLMSETHKAGLILHELLWYGERVAGAINSARARRTVARYFADNFDFQALGLKGEGVQCSSGNPSHQTNDFSSGNTFQMYFDEESKQFKLAFELLNGAPVHTGHFATLEDYEIYHHMADIEHTNDYPMNSEETFVVENFESSMTHYVTLKIEFVKDGEGVFKKKMYLSVTNNEFPGYNMPYAELECWPIGDKK